MRIVPTNMQKRTGPIAKVSTLLGGGGEADGEGERTRRGVEDPVDPALVPVVDDLAEGRNAARAELLHGEHGDEAGQRHAPAEHVEPVVIRV